MAKKKSETDVKKVGKIIEEDFNEKLCSNFINYALEVITARALPDVYTGLKPVQQRILQAAANIGVYSGSLYKKSVRLVGETLSSYHPHGDQSVYDAMVVMSQDFRYRCPLIDMSGNNGSLDGDPAAAMRYTESRMSKIGELMLTDINKNTVDMVPNYDESSKEAERLPSLFPNLLINPSEGIAVGMAGSFLPHNPKDIYKALDYILDCMINGNEPNEDKVISIVKAPDFPTGGVILGNDYIQGYKTGRASVKVQGKYEIEEEKGKRKIIITEIPYRVNKSNIVTKIDDLIRDKVIDGANAVHDLSAKGKVRIEVELKRDVDSNLIINKILKHTELRSSCAMLHVAIVDGAPKDSLSLMDLMNYFLQHAFNIVYRRTVFDIEELNKRIPILEALVKVLQNNSMRDEVIDAIETEKTEDKAIRKIMTIVECNEEQANYIADQKIRSLNSDRISKITEEYNSKVEKKKKLESIIKDSTSVLTQLKKELLDVAQLFKNEKRLTDIQLKVEDVSEKDLIESKDVLVHITSNDIIKVIEVDDISVQSRNGKGSKVKIKDNTYVKDIISMNTKDDLIIFTSSGKCYSLPIYKVPIVSKTSMGKYLSNYIDIPSSEKIIKILPIKDSQNLELFMSTKMGIGKRITLTGSNRISKGIRIINVDKDDELISVTVLDDTINKILIMTHDGFCLKFDIDKVRNMGRNARGCILIRFKDKNDYVISSLGIHDEEKISGSDDSVGIIPGDNIFTVSELGYGKILNVNEIRAVANKGGKGVKINNDKAGKLVKAIKINDNETIFISTKMGGLIRVKADSIPTRRRNGLGVKLIKLENGDKITLASSAPDYKEDEE